MNYISPIANSSCRVFSDDLSLIVYFKLRFCHMSWIICHVTHLQIFMQICTLLSKNIMHEYLHLAFLALPFFGPGVINQMLIDAR